MNNINANALLYGAYKHPLFSGFPGPSSGAGSISNIWGAATTPGGAGWHSEAWSGLGLYTNTYIPGWKKCFTGCRIKMGKNDTIKAKCDWACSIQLPALILRLFPERQPLQRYGIFTQWKSIYLSMDRSAAGSAATVGNSPATVGNCLELCSTI